MIKAFYNASTGTIWSQKGLDVTANNIANISTDGYKAQNTSFADLMYTNMRGAQEQNLKSGHGSKLNKTDTLFEQGSLKQTGRNLDFALNKDGFFAIQTAESVKYTRNGSFSLSEQADGSFALAAFPGGRVLDANGQPITVTDANANEDLNIGVYVFPNKDGLQREGNTLFTAGAFSGEAIVDSDAELLQGYLEASSVDLAEEMATMITDQRSFGMNVKMVQMADEIMDTLNRLR